MRTSTAFDLTLSSNSNIAMLDDGPTSFNEGSPPTGQPMQLLCEDDKGTYVLPYLCEWRDGGWHNDKGKTSGNLIAARVIGWRAARLHEQERWTSRIIQSDRTTAINSETGCFSSGFGLNNLGALAIRRPLSTR